MLSLSFTYLYIFRFFWEGRGYRGWLMVIFMWHGQLLHFCCFWPVAFWFNLPVNWGVCSSSSNWWWLYSTLQAEKEKVLGNAAYKKKDFEAALTHYDKAFELDGTDMTYLSNKAAVYFEQGKFDECVETCLKAVDVGRENRANFKQIAK